MNIFKEFKKNEKEDLKLNGSQVNLSSRSNYSTVSECAKPHRPHSAAVACSTHEEQHIKSRRPKSAGTQNRNRKCRHRFHWPAIATDTKADDPLRKSAMSVSLFTDSSSKLLQNLLEISSRNSAKNNISIEYSFENDFRHAGRGTPESNPLLGDANFQHLEMHNNNSNNFAGKPDDITRQNLEYFKIQSCPVETGEEKTVRFSDYRYLKDAKSQSVCGRGFHINNDYNRYSMQHAQTLPLCCGKRLRPTTSSLPDNTYKSKSILHEEVKLEACESIKKNKVVDEAKSAAKNQENLSSADHSAAICSTSENHEEKDTSQCNCFKKITENPKSPSTNPQTLEETKSNQSSSHNSNGSIQKPENLEQGEDAENLMSNNLQGNKNWSNEDSTFEEIVQLLQTLEEEDAGTMSLKPKQGSGEECLVPTSEVLDNINVVYSYLEEVEKDEESSDLSNSNVEKTFKTFCKGFDSPRLEELLNKNSVELAHEVLSLKIQIEDQKKGIKLLRETLAEMKEAEKTIELEHQEALHKASAEAETLVQRHQKFIKQLINEKKNLNETVSKLVHDLKSGEERHKRNMKAMEEKHLIEVKRAKEAQAIAEKVKREKWMEVKTQKIKEMTVKGLEPELSRMAVRQQEEMNELRNLHRAELESVELRAARRTSELMDQLRGELTKEKEQAIAKESAAVRASMERNFEDERNKMQSQFQILKDRIQREEQRLANRETEFQQKIIDLRRDAEKEQRRIANEYQEKIEELQRRHLIELKSLRESFEGEKEVWKNNYKKQQASLLFEKEAELHQQYKRERDREIEMVIEALEKESTKVQEELNFTTENKMRKLKEKFELDLKEAEASEAAIKSKLSETKSQLLEKEDVIAELNSQIRQCQSEMVFLRKSCEEMRSERINLKEMIREEFKGKIDETTKERQNLEKRITLLKESHLKDLAMKDEINVEARKEMQKELTRVYTRIKTAVNKKEKVIENLREEIKSSNQRCEHLEFLLDRQRRNLLL